MLWDTTQVPGDHHKMVAQEKGSRFTPNGEGDGVRAARWPLCILGDQQHLESGRGTLVLHRLRRCQKGKGEESHDSRPGPHPGPSWRGAAAWPPPCSLSFAQSRRQPTPGGAPKPGEGPAAAPVRAEHRLVFLPHRPSEA